MTLVSWMFIVLAVAAVVVAVLVMVWRRNTALVEKLASEAWEKTGSGGKHNGAVSFQATIDGGRVLLVRRGPFGVRGDPLNTRYYVYTLYLPSGHNIVTDFEWSVLARLLRLLEERERQKKAGAA